MPKKQANPVDGHVGHRVRLRRMLVGMSQERLGELLGLTFQQVQKYESGHNRVSASRLFDISRVLSCPISYFFEDINQDTIGERHAPSASAPEDLSEAGESFENDPMQRTETLELVRAYWRIHKSDLRQNVRDLLNNISRRE